jgi:type I restriction enzyme S subunit
MRPYLRVANVFEDRIDTADVMQMHFSDDEFERYRLQPGDVLLNEGQSPHLLGRPAIYRGNPPDVAFTNSLIRFRAGPAVTPHWALMVFRHHMRSKRFMRESRITTNIAHLSATRFSSVEFPVPPLSEQRRIVAAIEEEFSRVDTGLAALERIRKHLKRMRAAVLQAAVTGRLVPQDPADGDATPLVARAAAARLECLHARGRKLTQPLQLLDEALPDIPSSWRWASLDLLADVVGGITKDAKKQSSNRLIEVPYLRVANVQRGYLDLNKVATIRVSPDQRDALRLLPGDVLFNEGGDRDKLGRGWVWEGQIDPCIHQNHVFRARLHTDVLHPRLLSWHGNTFGQQWFTKGGKQTTNLASVSKTTLRSFPVPIPPRSEQDRIVDAVERQLSVLDQLEATVTTVERHGESLRTSILVAASSGQLVPQDPEDEPASVLLERIASEWAASNGQRFSAKTTRRGKFTT